MATMLTPAAAIAEKCGRDARVRAARPPRRIRHAFLGVDAVDQ